MPSLTSVGSASHIQRGDDLQTKTVDVSRSKTAHTAGSSPGPMSLTSLCDQKLGRVFKTPVRGSRRVHKTPEPHPDKDPFIFKVPVSPSSKTKAALANSLRYSAKSESPRLKTSAIDSDELDRLNDLLQNCSLSFAPPSELSGNDSSLTCSERTDLSSNYTQMTELCHTSEASNHIGYMHSHAIFLDDQESGYKLPVQDFMFLRFEDSDDD